MYGLAKIAVPDNNLNEGPNQSETNKHASLLGLLGLAGAVHVVPNIGMKAIKSTKAGHNALTGTFSAGVEMGRTGRKLHPNAQSLIEYGIGPETLVDYRLGRRLGEKLKDIPADRQERFLNKAKGMGEAHIRNAGGVAEDIEKVPILNTLNNYIEGRGENKVKKGLMRMSVPDDQPVTWKNKAGNLAMLGAAAAVEPHLLMQPAISATRKTVAQSNIGQKFIDNQFHKGRQGQKLSKAKEVGLDLALSPAALDPYRIGKFVSDKGSKELNDNLKDVSIGKMLAPK